MKKSGKQLFSLLLSCTMLAGTVSMPVSAVSDAAPVPAAADNEETAQTAAVQNTVAAADTAAEATVSDYAKSEPISFTVDGSSTVYTINANDIQLEVTAPVLASDDTVEIDTSSPIIMTVESELNDIKVLNDEGVSVALTEKEIQTIIGLYGEYVKNWEDNADVLGVQLPFFYSYNDDKDSLGIIGEMLVLAGKSVDDVRKGNYTYNQVVGMLNVFLLGNMIGAEQYRDTIAEKRNDAMNAIKESGAQTYAQKMLVLNNWIAQNVEFDMAYLMNSGEDGSEKMKAPNPKQHQFYDVVYNTSKSYMEKALDTQFRMQIKDGVIAQFRQQYYEGAIRNIVYQQALNNVVGEVTDEDREKAKEEVYDTAYADAEKEVRNNAIETYQATQEETDRQNAINAYIDDCVKDEKHEYHSVYKDAYDAEKGRQIQAARDSDDNWNEKYSEYYSDYVNNYNAEKHGAYDSAEKYATAMADAECLNMTEIEKAADAAGRKALEDDEDVTKAANAAADETVKANSKAAADKAVAEKTVEIEAAANQKVEDRAKEIAKDREANAAADAYMEENADAISEDAPGFVKATFGAEAAEQIAAGCNAFIEEAETEGVEVDPENAPGYKMTIDEIVEKQMGQPLDDLGGMKPNEAVPVYAEQAATEMTPAIINGWKGSHIGALGDGVGVCVGYAKAFAYLVQFMSPEQYGVDGANTDMTVAKNWKTSDELYYDADGNINIDAGYNVDLVRITYNANVSMFGQDSVFGEVHFWNAVKVDGVWYYIDPCYIDIYTECMDRTRVETNGDINNLYFLVSHTSIAKLYNGYYKEIASLYTDAAVNTHYEDSWMARIRSSVYSDGTYFYYSYDSTDMISMKEDNSYSETETAYKLVRHKITNTDSADNGDNDYETLIHFNYYESDEDDESSVAVYTAAGKRWTDKATAWLTELYAEHLDMEEIYPALTLSVGLYEGKVYFNLSNKLLCYDIAAGDTGDIYVVKEYNTVSATRDLTVQLGGMAFTVTDTKPETKFYETADGYKVPTYLTVENHPIAGFTIKRDGKMYIDIATNFSYISGNDDMDLYGYEFEESDYNTAYNSYVNEHNDGSYGYENDTNDNDEFMWSANFREELEMNHLSGESHNYKEVSISAFCEKDAFTEERCTECGKINPDTRTIEKGTAHEHHFIRFEEIYYTKGDNGSYNTGFCYVCVECGYHVEEPTEPDENENYEQAGTSYEEQMAIYEEQKAIYDEIVANAGHIYVPTDAKWSEDGTQVTFSRVECEFECCHNRAETLDLFTDDNTSKNPVSQKLSEPVTADAEAVGYEGECSVGITTVYEAEGTFKTKYGTYKYRAENKVTGEAGEHAVQSEFTWTPAVDEEGNPTEGYTVTASLSCLNENCEAHSEEIVEAEVTPERTEPTCTKEGSVTYTAVASRKDAEGNVIISATDTKTDVLEKVPHSYNEKGICSVCGAEKPTEFAVTGTVTSYTTKSASDALVKITVYDEEGNVAIYEVPADKTEYEIMLPSGTYTMEVSKTNHVTRTYEIVVEEEAVTQDVEICLIGDVNKDGKVNVDDVNDIFDYALKEIGLEDPYTFACADVNRDGKVNVDDVNDVYYHALEREMLW